MLKKKFLVLGTGNAQIDLLRLLWQNYHFEIHALSNTELGRACNYCDFFEKIDIADKEAVLEYSRQKGIDYIYSIGSDIEMPTVAYVSEQLNRPTFVSYQTATICNNKALFREKLQHCYGAVPFEIASSKAELQRNQHVNFPLIIKPVDSQGQRGVGSAQNAEQSEALFDSAISHSRCKQVILEEQITGTEVSINAYLNDGKLQFFFPSRRVSWPQFDGGIIHKHVSPVKLTDPAIKNLKRLVIETLAKLEIANGPAYFQIKLDGDTPKLIEVTPRFDGCHMWRLIQQACGINLLERAVEDLIQQSSVQKISPQLNVNCTLEFYCQPPNEIFKVPNDKSDVQYREFYYDEGDHIREMNGKMEKCGYKIYLA